FKGNEKRVRQSGFGDNIFQVDAQLDDGLGDLRPDAANDTVGAHQSGGGNRFQQMLRHQGVHHGNAADIDDRDVRAGLDDFFQQALHDDLGTGAVQSSDQR